MPLGKFIFFHLLVLVSIAFSISFLAPAALISVRAAFPHVRVFFFRILVVCRVFIFFPRKYGFAAGVVP